AFDLIVHPIYWSYIFDILFHAMYHSFSIKTIAPNICETSLLNLTNLFNVCIHLHNLLYVNNVLLAFKSYLVSILNLYCIGNSFIVLSNIVSSLLLPKGQMIRCHLLTYYVTFYGSSLVLKLPSSLRCLL
ncbi:hypothetical protein L9F63_028374, partial [Diploptera punctata]